MAVTHIFYQLFIISLSQILCLKEGMVERRFKTKTRKAHEIRKREALGEKTYSTV